MEDYDEFCRMAALLSKIHAFPKEKSFSDEQEQLSPNKIKPKQEEESNPLGTWNNSAKLAFPSAKPAIKSAFAGAKALGENEEEKGSPLKGFVSG